MWSKLLPKTLGFGHKPLSIALGRFDNYSTKPPSEGSSDPKVVPFNLSCKYSGNRSCNHACIFWFIPRDHCGSAGGRGSNSAGDDECDEAGDDKVDLHRE